MHCESAFTCQDSEAVASPAEASQQQPQEALKSQQSLVLGGSFWEVLSCAM